MKTKKTLAIAMITVAALSFAATASALPITLPQADGNVTEYSTPGQPAAYGDGFVVSGPPMALSVAVPDGGVTLVLLGGALLGLGALRRKMGR